MKAKKTTKKTAKALPKTFQGAKVVRGLGMKSDELDTFTEEKALDGFNATGAMWIVVADGVLEDHGSASEVTGFLDKNAAIRFAQARANGNIDHRVLRVTDQVLVVGTQNDL